LRVFALSVAVLCSTTASAAPAPKAAGIVADANAPKGKLPNVAAPTAYRLDFTVLPEQDRFTGHDEIDVTLKQAAKSIYMHGRDLDVTRAVAVVGGKTVPAKWVQVDKTGTARLDFASQIPAGDVTLKFDYSAPFGDSASGMFHVKVADKWYAWTQFESIDARAAFPGFDEPGFKTPFTVSVTTRPGYVVVGNSPEASVTKAAGGMVKHQLAPTRPLPTYLVAVDTGPFVHEKGMIPPDAERSTPMPYGAVATQAQKDKMGYVMAETPRIVSLLEKYFGEPFPFPKLDQIGTPIMPGAMENAGADTYGDSIIYLNPGATTGDKQAFGMIVAHELSHQWFGDLVTPAWWDDIWLNESFANWMGYRIGNEWRPELKIGVGALGEGFGAMNTDALTVGRPIHQSIATNGEIDSAFDGITYGKGGCT
jgi:aminopeptidase N